MIFHTNDADIICQQYLHELYPERVISEKATTQSLAQTYGEILYPSVTKLLSMLCLKEEDTFVDLGSGLGKVVIQAFLNTSVKTAMGIEIVPSLHQKALFAQQKIYADFPELKSSQRSIKFIQGDFLQIPFKEATVVFICSSCFPPALLLKLSSVINSLPKLHTLLSLRPMHGLKLLKFNKTVRVEGSWDTALCYVYKK